MLKFFGVLMIFVSCAALGFFKAFSLGARVKSLKQIYAGLDLLYIRISQTNDELPKVLKTCFSDCRCITIDRHKALILKDCLKPSDITVLEELFSTLGSGNKESECAKISLCKTQIEKNLLLAEKTYLEGAKIWQTLGVCTGLALGIMVI